MDTAKPQRRKHIPSTVMREKLIDAVIHLARTIPYSDINARRIADELSVDPKTIFRCFPTLQDLYLATLDTMHRHVVDQIAKGEGGDIRPVEMAEEMTRFAVWMSLNGVAANDINAVNDGGDTALKPYSLNLVGLSGEASPRARDAFYCLMMSFLTAQVTVAPLQTSVFTPDILNDVTALLFTLSQELPTLANTLGWSASEAP